MSALEDFMADQSGGGFTIEGLREGSNGFHAAALHAFVRQGADEIAAILPAFPGESVPSQPEMGQMMEPTQAMVSKAIMDQEISTPEMSAPQPEMEMDMG